jgi:hypothetical protein
MTKWTKRVGIPLLLAIAGYVIYVQALKWHNRAMETSLEQNRQAWQREGERLKSEITGLKEELALKQEATLPEERLQEVFGEDAEAGGPPEVESSCDVLDGKVREFFAYLDTRDYVKAYRLKDGVLDYFQTLLAKLSRHPPMVSAELKDPYLLIQNVAHFYRVLGKVGVLLAREVVVNESEIAEPVGALFYQWSTAGERCKEGLEPPPPLSRQYEYAGFFLNSLGGRSYLLRRDPRVRILTTYYSVLILDRANGEDLNRHGIDIRPHIDSVAQEIRNSRSLFFQKEYLDKLETLREKYAAQ